MTRKLLFLCTGNYYRSRFAEAHFNAIASRSGLSWRADSRGLAVELLALDAGPIAVEAVEGLQARGIRADEDPRFPMQARDEDFDSADLIIALNEQEHRPYLERKYPGWAQKVEYWHIGDLDILPPGEALSAINREVQELVRRLSRSQIQLQGGP